MKTDRALALAAFVTVCIVWGTTYLAIRVAVASIPPVLLTGLRYTVAGTALLALMWMRGERVPRDPRTLGTIAFVSVLLIGIGNLAVVWAEQWVPSGTAALLVATAPFWATILELLQPEGERFSLRRALGMVIGFGGVGLLVTPGGAGGSWDSHFVVGALVIQVGSFCWQAGSVVGKRTLGGVAPLMSAALQMLFGGLILDVAGLAVGELGRFHPTPQALAGLAYLSVFGSILAYTAYTYAISKLPITTVSLYSYANPIVAVLLGWLILGEQLTRVSLLAMVVILAGMALVQTAGRRPAAAVVTAGRRQPDAA